MILYFQCMVLLAMVVKLVTVMRSHHPHVSNDSLIQKLRNFTHCIVQSHACCCFLNKLISYIMSQYSSTVCILGIVKVWAFLAQNITLKPASFFFHDSLADAIEAKNVFSKFFQQVLCNILKFVQLNFLLTGCLTA